MQFGSELHDYMRDYANLSENEKPLAVSGCLLALRDDAFKASWRKLSIKNLGRELIAAIRREIESAVPGNAEATGDAATISIPGIASRAEQGASARNGMAAPCPCGKD
jgi:hypothetical protein